ncbi:hypothetical protein [Magnetospira sp. QH-2]|uniref:hypothetical protein n=1 Tax=Magnetospira sp. (strain QH-2) TaxID=1288970 RepID=UPI0005F9CDD3|nr:hypothetical protein [Magnetospira sp. QH-2]
MKLWKAFTNSMINLLSVLDNFTEGTNELSLMYRDACQSARKEQALEVAHELEHFLINPSHIRQQRSSPS